MDAEDIRDLFAEAGPVRIRRMFGGQGVFAGDLMFALEADGELYIKADAKTSKLFVEAGSEEFFYTKADGKVFRMSYWRLPDSALDDPSEVAVWAGYGMQAARRAALAKAAGKRRR